MFKNMKIGINKEQPLDDVIDELERIGYSHFAECDNPRYVVTHSEGAYQSIMFPVFLIADWPLTTLAELKEM